MSDSVWRIQFEGRNAWLGDMYEGDPLVRLGQDDALWWPTEAEAQAVADALPPRPVGHRVIERPAGTLRVWSWARPGTTCWLPARIISDIAY